MKQAGETKEVRIADLQPHPDNYRSHPPDQLRRLQASLEKHGQYRTVVVQASTNRILAGHGVVEAAKQRGEETILACLVDVDDAGALQILVDDNELARHAEDDGEALAEVIATLHQDYDLHALTWETDAEVEDLLRELTMPRMGEAEEDEPPEPQAEAVSRTGDLWICGEHRVLCGDCTVAEDVAKLVAGGEVRMVWTDPPYGVDYANHGNNRWGRHAPIHNDALTEDGMAQLWASALTLAAGVATGDLYMAAPPGPLLTILDDTVRDHTPWERHQWLVWVKQALVLGRSNYHYRHEQILYGWLKKGKSSWSVGRDRDSVFEADRPSRSEEHPTMKPVALVAAMVENSSRHGEGVYDPFLGSGTTMIACEQLSRRCYGIEIEPRYVDVSVRRWQNLTGQEAILESTGRTFAQTENERLHE